MHVVLLYIYQFNLLIVEFDNINEVGDEIAEVIPESLSASDNLIMLEPVKVNCVKILFLNMKVKF